jgi:hypothetical protein
MNNPTVAGSNPARSHKTFSSKQTNKRNKKPIGRAHTTGENGEWGETKQRSEKQVAFNSVL